MHPILFKLGPFTVYSYGFFYGLGIVVAMAVAEYRARKLGIDPRRVLDLGLLLVFLIPAGARAFYVLQFWDRTGSGGAFRIWEGGQVLYGGLILAVVAALLFARHYKLDLAKLGDTFAPAVALGVGVGRIGCFLNGCCYGTPAENIPWAASFPKLYSAKEGIIGSPAFVKHMSCEWVESSATRSLPVHPTQLYAMLLWLTLGVALLFMGSHRLFRGRLIWAFLMLYGAGRFCLEVFRGDNAPVLAGLTISQMVGVLVVVGSGVVFWRAARTTAGAYSGGKRS